ncbi:MAG TPA: histidine kinase N-terminal 7TM domain-containing protein [Anaerolineales bacterium]|nr:histidine kinase N-terminal 7TM domain-containing protein [Anaerolineales bacterium]
MDILITVIRTLNDVLTAGIAITAVSLLGYALTFNLRDRVARSFALILGCVVVVFTGDALSGVEGDPGVQELLLRLEWTGLVFLPSAYLHFSDALLATTGKPSRGRRRTLVRLAYLVSALFLILLPTGRLVGGLVVQGAGMRHLSPTPLTWVFAGFYVTFVGWAWVNFMRAYNRSVSATSRRRMTYLLAGAASPALGSFPYLVLAGPFAGDSPLLFWSAALVTNAFVFVLLVMMAYAVAFFGVSWPDRVVKRRLAKWLMRGPFTASVVLGVVTLVNRAGAFLGWPVDIAVPVIMVTMILFMEHTISMAAPVWERVLFSGGDRENLRLLQTLEERLLTREDLRQFLEGILAAVCDQFQVPTAFVAAAGESSAELLVHTGGLDWRDDDLSDNILEAVRSANGQDVYAWGEYWLQPLFSERDEILIGVLGVLRSGDSIDEERRVSILELGERAALALEDLRRQGEVFTSLRSLTPQVELIQRLRAAARYDRVGALSSTEDLPGSPDFAQAVKEALSHYWGGPKLRESPLMRLAVVQQALDENDENAVNALRAILRQAIDRVRPEGERRFTAEWILFNILELKFMEGRKVREVALRLAMSEADLYRKQRVAIDAVAEAIIEMEEQMLENEARDQNRAV